MPMLDFRVETFLAVCRHMNFTKAARELNITQPAVSHHMHYLEQAYGTALFQHNGKRLQLTEAGEILRRTLMTMKHDEQHLQSACSRPPPARATIRSARRSRSRSS